MQFQLHALQSNSKQHQNALFACTSNCQIVTAKEIAHIDVCIDEAAVACKLMRHAVANFHILEKFLREQSVACGSRR